MKLILFFAAILNCTSAFGASWTVVIKDGSTSEIKTYSFDQSGSRKLELPKFKNVDCALVVSEPFKVELGDTSWNAQKAELQCFLQSGAVVNTKACHNSPDNLDKATGIITQVIESRSASKTSKSKVPALLSYVITVDCS